MFVVLLCGHQVWRRTRTKKNKQTKTNNNNKTTARLKLLVSVSGEGLSNTWVRKNAAELPTTFATRHASERLMKLFLGSSTTLLEGLINSGDSTLSMLK